MTIPNLIALVLLFPEFSRDVQQYFALRKLNKW